MPGGAQAAQLVPGDPTDAKAVQLACAVCLRKRGERAAAGQLLMTLLKEDETDFDVLLEYAVQVRLRWNGNNTRLGRGLQQAREPPPHYDVSGAPL